MCQLTHLEEDHIIPLPKNQQTHLPARPPMQQSHKAPNPEPFQATLPGKFQPDPVQKICSVENLVPDKLNERVKVSKNDLA